MSCALLAAQRVLNIPWLQHLSPLVKQGKVRLKSGRKQQGDLVGKDTLSHWHVVEAKGRSHTIDSGLRSYAKGQALRILLIRGKKPSTYCTSLTNLARKPILIEFNDPDPIDDFSDLNLGETIDDIEIDDLTFTREYYSFISHLFRELPMQVKEWSIEGRTLSFDVVELPLTDIYVGLYGELTPLIELPDQISLENLSQICHERLLNIREVPALSIGTDGIIVAQKQGQSS